MIFKIRWSDMQRGMAQKLLVSESSEPVVRFYYESEDAILFFLKTKGVLVYSEIPVKSITNLNNFKFEFFNNAIELLENPLGGKAK